MSDNRRITQEWAGELYSRYAERLYRQALMILWDSGLAEDAMHQVFVKMLNQHGEAGEIESWEGYLIRAVRNECYRILRRRRKLPVQLSLKAQILEPVDDMHGDQQERQKVERALRGLPSEQREVIQLKVYEGMTFHRIAEVLKIPANTVASRYRYAMDKLRTYLLNDKHGNHYEF